MKILFLELQRLQYYKHEVLKPSKADGNELVGWGLLEYEMMECHLVEDHDMQDTGMNDSKLVLAEQNLW